MKPAVSSATRLGAAVHSLVGRPLFWVALIATIAAWPVVWAVKARLPPPPPVLGTAPAFRLTDQRGGAFGSDELAGRVWIASFAPAGAAGEDVARALGRVQARARNLEPALHLVSFSVRPPGDSPERLAAYARTHRASPRMWTFVTGAPEAVRAVERGLRGPPAQEARGPLAGERSLVLVDRGARIRGRYDPGEPGAVERLVRDAALLVNRPR